MKACTLFLLLALVACDRKSPSERDASATATDAVGSGSAGFIGEAKGVVAAPAAPPPVANEAAEFSKQAVADRRTAGDAFQNIDLGASAPSMLIRTGQAFIEVEKVDPAILRIRQLAAQSGAYITNSTISGGRDQIRQATLELKIPAPKYEQALSALSTIGKVETVTSTAQDVGEEFVDVTARVNNSRRLEERLISLLASRTGKLDEVLRVERELARVREEIERYEGRLRYLSSRVAMSTLSITVHEPAPILGTNPGENPIAAALRRAWRNFVALLSALIASLGVVIPLAAFGFVAWYGYRRWKRK